MSQIEVLTSVNAHGDTPDHGLLPVWGHRLCGTTFALHVMYRATVALGARALHRIPPVAWLPLWVSYVLVGLALLPIAPAARAHTAGNGRLVVGR